MATVDPRDVRSGDLAVARAAELLKALASPVRLGLVVQLDRHGPSCVHELTTALRVPQPLVSQHLRVLRTARLITGERVGREIRYSISDDHVRHIVADAVRHAEEALP